MKKVCLFVGMLLLFLPLGGCKKKGKKDTQDKGTSSAMTAASDMATADEMAAPDGMKPAGESGLVKVDGVKPEHEKIEWVSKKKCKITVVTEKVKKELESKEDHQKIHVVFSSKTTNKLFKTVANIPWVTKMTLKNTEVTDLGPIGGLKHLKGLFLERCKGADLSPIGRLTQLEYLWVEHPQAEIKDLSFVKGLQKLIDFNLSYCKHPPKDINGISSLNRLKTLRILSCGATDLKPLAALKNLEQLKLHGNPIKDVSPLAGLEKLNGLNLRDTKVKKLTSLTKLKKLEYLTVSKTVPKNQIKRLKKAIGSGLSITVK